MVPCSCSGSLGEIGCSGDRSERAPVLGGQQGIYFTLCKVWRGCGGRAALAALVNTPWRPSYSVLGM